MENRIAQTNVRLNDQVIRAINGLKQHEVEFGLTFVRSEPLQETLDAFTAANTACKAFITAHWKRQMTLKALRKDARQFLRVARDVLKVYLGPHYNTHWIEPGFVHSLEIPRNRAEVLSVLSALAAYLKRNPQHGNAALEVSEERALFFFNEINTATDAVHAAKSDLCAAVTSRDKLGGELRRALRFMIKELSMRLPPLDGRWAAFGLNAPGRKATPDAPENVEAKVVAGPRLLVKWPRAARAEHYRVWVREVGVDAEPKTVGSPKERDFMIENASPGSTLEIGVSAVNNAGESRVSDMVRLTIGEIAASAQKLILTTNGMPIDRRV